MFLDFKEEMMKLNITTFPKFCCRIRLLILSDWFGHTSLSNRKSSTHTPKGVCLNWFIGLLKKCHRACYIAVMSFYWLRTNNATCFSTACGCGTYNLMTINQMELANNCHKYLLLQGSQDSKYLQKNLSMSFFLILVLYNLDM